MAVNPDGVASGCSVMTINGLALLLNIALLTNLVVNHKSLPPYMALVFNLAVADLIFSFLGAHLMLLELRTQRSL